MGPDSPESPQGLDKASGCADVGIRTDVPDRVTARETAAAVSRRGVADRHRPSRKVLLACGVWERAPCLTPLHTLRLRRAS